MADDVDCWTYACGGIANGRGVDERDGEGDVEGESEVGV